LAWQSAENPGNVDSIHTYDFTKREKTAEKCRENGQNRSLRNFQIIKITPEGYGRPR